MLKSDVIIQKNHFFIDWILNQIKITPPCYLHLQVLTEILANTF